ncbi:hypothetical protein B296_00016322 [Ensete ventricosum]|uniref:Uncharacterized protein n=1 Tax=Ensete ventricosum TaxID=4639 RepID=A0A426YT28_ENSVE|nr:hypothetical protein B296_00016322 [Ensete ventricosum]
MLRFHSEVNKEEGQPAPMQCWPPTARPRPRPHARGWPATQGQPVREASVARKGSNPQGRPAPLAGAVARRGGTCGHGRLRPACKGGSRPQAHPLVARRPQGAVAPAIGVAAPWQGGCRCARAAAVCVRVVVATTTAKMGQEGFSHYLLFSSLPLRKSYEIILEEFRYRDPSYGYQ